LGFDQGHVIALHYANRRRSPSEFDLRPQKNTPRLKERGVESLAQI
jgi:hypothetical protein